MFLSLAWIVGVFMVGIGHVDSKDYRGAVHRTRCAQHLGALAYIRDFARFVNQTMAPFKLIAALFLQAFTIMWFLPSLLSFEAATKMLACHF